MTKKLPKAGTLTKMNQKLTLMAIIPMLTCARDLVNTRIIDERSVALAGGKFFGVKK